MFERIIKKQIIASLNRPEIVIINGARRVGKTTLVKHIQKEILLPSYYFDFTDPATLRLWSNFSRQRINAILSDLGFEKKRCVLFFDEIQYFEDIGILLKLFYDHFPKIKIIATGSSSFLMLQNIGDSLTGRKKIYNLYPLTLSEYQSNPSKLKNYWIFGHYPLLATDLTEKLASMLIYGSYPEIINLSQKNERIDKLREIVDSYLYKDLLMIEGIKQPKKIVELSRLLAYQIGNPVNANELSATLGLSRDTVIHYIDLLEKFFIVYRLYPYQHDLRNTIKKQFKVYFFDTGIRNAVIGDFSMLENRQDRGFLLESAVVTGIKRRIDYNRKLYKLFFWRNYDGKEVDILIKKNDDIGFEIKWEAKKNKIAKGFPAKGKIVSFPQSYRFVL